MSQFSLITDFKLQFEGWDVTLMRDYNMDCLNVNFRQTLRALGNYLHRISVLFWFKIVINQIKKIILHFWCVQIELYDLTICETRMENKGCIFDPLVNPLLENCLNAFALFPWSCVPHYYTFQKRNSRIIELKCFEHSILLIVQNVSSAGFLMSNLSWTTMLTMSAQLRYYRQSFYCFVINVVVVVKQFRNDETIVI